MSEVNKNMYLDLAGLKKYDVLIKQFITDNDSELSNAIAALNAKLGEFEFDSSDDKTVAAILEDIKGAIAELVAKDAELEANDAELEKKIAEEIGKIVGELGESDSHMTLVQIAAQLKSLGDSVSANTDSISKITERVAAVEKSIADLGEIEGGENLGTVVGKVNSNYEAIATLKGEEDVVGSVKNTAKSYAEQAQAAAEATAAADATTKANAAETAAKGYADELNGAMDGRVAALKKNEHNHENKTVLDGISAEKVAAWDAAEQNAKDYADSLASNYDAAGAATTAAAQALADAKTYADGKDTAMDSRVVEIEGKVESWDAAAGRINTFLDSEEVAGTVDTLHEIQEWMNGEGVNATELTAAIAAEAKLREDADKAINDKIGAVTEGKTVVGMVGDAQTAAVASAKSYTDEREVAINAALAEKVDNSYKQEVSTALDGKVDDSEFSEYQTTVSTALDGKVDNSYKEEVTAALDKKATVDALNELGGKVDTDIQNLTNLLGDYSGTLGDVDDRLVVLESFVEAHESISESDIIGLFTPNTEA